jgi:crossover junction endodeoxyribonuclease RuvC
MLRPAPRGVRLLPCVSSASTAEPSSPATAWWRPSTPPARRSSRRSAPAPSASARRDHTPVRLAQVYAELTALLQLWQPEVVAIEEVFFSANAKSALKLGQVRGVAMLAAANCGLPVAEYAPLTIKSSVVGYGLAAKEQVGFMVARLLELDEPPQPADAADALAIAICHIHHAQTEAQLRR